MTDEVQPPRYYEADRDALIVQQGEDDFAFIPPVGSSLVPCAFLVRESVLEMATFAAQKSEGAIWSLPLGARELRGPLFYNEDDGS